jgi:gluconolactonase
MIDPGRRAMVRAIAAGAALGTGLVAGFPFNAHAQSPVPPPPAPPLPPVDPVVESIEELSAGHLWTEGPLWVGGRDGYLLFTDPRANIVYKWDGEVSEYLKPGSGLQGPPWADPEVREGGSNGMGLARGGLVICDEGVRCITWVDMKTKARRVLVDRYQGKRLNSPNDLVVARDGNIYFTDPPFGLNGGEKSPELELDFSGVFRLSPDNQLHLITDKIFPNGIALSPDQNTLYSSSRAGWMAYTLDKHRNVTSERVHVPSSVTGGGGDGMKMDRYGNLWASSRGAIHVFSPKGERIGAILGGGSNCAFDPNGYVYITRSDKLVRGKISAMFRKKLAQKI